MKFRSIKKADFDRDISRIQTELGDFLNVDNTELTVQTQYETYSLLDLYSSATNGHFSSLRELVRLSFCNAKNNRIREFCFNAIEIMSADVDRKSDPHSRYYYSLCLLENDRIDDGIAILKFLAQDNFPPALCRLGVIDWLGAYGKRVDMQSSREFLKAASDLGHVRGRLFYTRLKMRHGSVAERLFSPLNAIADFFHAIKVGRNTQDNRSLY